MYTEDFACTHTRHYRAHIHTYGIYIAVRVGHTGFQCRIRQDSRKRIQKCPESIVLFITAATPPNLPASPHMTEPYPAAKANIDLYSLQKWDNYPVVRGVAYKIFDSICGTCIKHTYTRRSRASPAREFHTHAVDWRDGDFIRMCQIRLQI